MTPAYAAPEPAPAAAAADPGGGDGAAGALTAAVADAGGGAAARYVRRKLRRPRRGPGGVGCFPPGLAAATTTGGGGRKVRGRLGGAEAAGRRPSRPPGCLCRGLEAPITGERHWGAAVVLVLGLFWRITYSAPSPRRGRRPRGRSREPSRRGRRKVTRMVTRTIGGVRPTPQRERGGGGEWSADGENGAIREAECGGGCRRRSSGSRPRRAAPEGSGYFSSDFATAAAGG